MILLWFLTLIVSLFVLLKAADYFIDSAILIGKRLNVPSFVLGATIIAFGTSLPELVVGLSAILKNEPAIISGTVIGSNISNIFFILGVALISAKGFNVKFKENAIALVFLMFITGLTTFFLWDNFYSITEGVISTILLAIYIIYIVLFPPEEDEDEEETEPFSLKAIIYLILGGLFIWLGSEFVVKAVIEIAKLLQIAEDIIALTLVALGTSLPELAVTISAAKKKKYGILIGNVIGSNIFNLLCVLGIPVIVGHFTGHLYQIEDSIFTTFSIPMMIIATVLLFLLSFSKGISKAFGVLFVALYLLFLIGTFFNFSIINF